MQDDNFEDFEEEFEEEFIDESVANLVKSAAKSADNLTTIIVENNRHNSQKMTTEDIYQIYIDSFGVALRTVFPSVSE